MPGQPNSIWKRERWAGGDHQFKGIEEQPGEVRAVIAGIKPGVVQIVPPPDSPEREFPDEPAGEDGKH